MFKRYSSAYCYHFVLSSINSSIWATSAATSSNPTHVLVAPPAFPLSSARTSLDRLRSRFSARRMAVPLLLAGWSARSLRLRASLVGEFGGDFLGGRRGNVQPLDINPQCDPSLIRSKDTGSSLPPHCNAGDEFLTASFFDVVTVWTKDDEVITPMRNTEWNPREESGRQPRRSASSRMKRTLR
jgi:hypothetical protein